MGKIDITEDVKVKVSRETSGVGFYLRFFYKKDQIGYTNTKGKFRVNTFDSFDSYEFQGEHFGNFRIFKK